MRIFYPGILMLASSAALCAQDAAPAAERNYALRTTTGYYLTAENGGGGAINSDRQEIGPWETFTLVTISPGVFAFRTVNGFYLSDIAGEPQRGRQSRNALAATKKDAGPASQFKLMLMRPEDNTVALVTAAGKYVTVENNGGMKTRGTRAVSTNREQIGPWEQLVLVDIEKEQAKKNP